MELLWRTFFQQLVYCLHINLGHVGDIAEHGYELANGELAGEGGARGVLAVEEEGDYGALSM